MNILFVTTTSSLYGANRSLLNLIKYLLKKKHVINVLLPREGRITEELNRMGCNYLIRPYYSCVYTLPYINWRYFLNQFYLNGLLDEIKGMGVDIIHTNSSVYDIGAILASRLNIPHIWHVREMPEHYHMKYLRPRLYRKLREQSDRVICISQTVYEYNSLRFKTDNMVVIYNGFLNEKEQTNLNAFSHHKVIMLIAGMITVNKGQAEAIEAVNILVNDMGYTNIFLIVAGEGEKAYVNRLKKKVAEYKLENYIEFKGFDDNLQKTRMGCDITLQCSRMEGLGRVTIESMMDNVLVIGARSGATSELITDGENGLLYTPGDAAELADKIKYAISHKEECRRIIRKAKQWAVSNFDNERIGELMEKQYLDVLS